MNVAAPNILRFPRAWFDSTRDSFQNFLAGFGVPGRDKAVSQFWAYYPLDAEQLEAAYRSDWVARKIVEIPAFDATRSWRLWQMDKEDQKQIEAAERAYNLQRKLLDGLIKARLYGGAAIILGVNQGTFQEELQIDKVGKGDLKFVHVVSRYSLAAGPTVKEITSPWYGHPTYYQRANTVTVSAPGGVEPIGEPTMGQAPGDMLYIHPSRVIRLIGLDYPDLERAPDAWGDTVLQPVADALKAAGMVTSSMATMIAEAKLDIIKVPALTAKMQTAEGTQNVLSRFMQTNVAKSSINALLIDKEEEWERHQLQLSNYDKVLSSYFLLCCAAADVPATRFMGREPAGQNATGDSDTRNYYDRLASDQKVRQTPALRPLDEVLLRSTFGTRDDAWRYDWNALWLMSDAEKADVELKKAQAHKVDVDAGLLSPHVLQIGRENSLVESGFLYPGIETAIDDEADWDAEEGVQQARTKGMMDPNDPDVIEAKGKVMAASKPPPFGGKPGGKPNGGGRPNGGVRDARSPFRRLRDAPPPAVIFDPELHPHGQHGRWSTTGRQGKPPAQKELFPGQFPPIPEVGEKVAVPDFDKAKVEIANPIKNDPEKLRKFLDLWDEKVREAPEGFKSEFMGGLPGTMRISEISDTNWQIAGYIEDKDGARIGEYIRLIDFDKNEAESDYFKLNHRATGKDTGKALLAGNIAVYQKMGIDTVKVHANIDVGGYAWAKYGYVPTGGDWETYAREKLDELAGGTEGYEASSWEEIDSDEQDRIFKAWAEGSESDFLDSEIESWRDNGGDLVAAKTELAENGFDSSPATKWAWEGVRKYAVTVGEGDDTKAVLVGPYLASKSTSIDAVLAATTVSWDDRRGDGEADPDVTIDAAQTTELSDDDREQLAGIIVEAFNKEAENRRGDIDPPDYLAENIRDYQKDVWESMRDRDKFKWADENGELRNTGVVEGTGEIDSDDAETLRSWIDDGDPKSIWEIADSEHGKKLLLGSDWYGELDLNDEDSMARFNAYVGKVKPHAAAPKPTAT
jgi:hypothetical protein